MDAGNQEQLLSHAASDADLRFRTVLDAAIDAIILGDTAGNIIGWNAGAEAIFGYSEAEALGKPLTLLIPERFRGSHTHGLERLHQTGERHLVGRTSELQAVRKDGREFPIEISLGTWTTGEGRFFCGIVRDITERKLLEEALRQAALYDALSELPNRLFLSHYLEQMAEKAARDDGRVAVMMVDIDNFKSVNDRFGHHIGDLLIRGTGQRLMDAVRPGDVVARIGGDEFVVALEGIHSLDDARMVANRIVIAMKLPFSLEGLTIRISASVGVGLGQGDFDEDEILQEADKALYRAKADGKAKYELPLPS